ncbi:MAG: 3-oxoacyl-[acyl-carrier-protein] synthase-3 [Pseudohongiellaceae bacterium]|jgi:3-oxoacyl-[acyl-carrier-protein] synthase-3
MTAFFSDAKLKLISSGSSLPGPPISNSELFELITRHCGKRASRRAAMIARMLGISSRHFARCFHEDSRSENITAPQLCFSAIENACNFAGTSLSANDYLIGHTTTPYTLLPPNIAWVADKLNYEGPYMELRQACTGFANALHIASAMLATNSTLNQITVVGSEVGSMYCELTPEFMDREQLVNLVQMGDSSGAVILAAEHHHSPHLISDIYLGQIGLNRQPGFQLSGGGSKNPVSEKSMPFFQHQVSEVRQQGKELFQLGLEAILNRGYQLADFRFIIPHQANGFISELLAEYLNIQPERIINDAKYLGNMGSAAIWVCLDRLRRSGRLEAGDKVLVLGAEATKYLYGGFVYQH